MARGAPSNGYKGAKAMGKRNQRREEGWDKTDLPNTMTSVNLASS